MDELIKIKKKYFLFLFLKQNDRTKLIKEIVRELKREGWSFDIFSLSILHFKKKENALCRGWIGVRNRENLLMYTCDIEQQCDSESALN